MTGAEAVSDNWRRGLRRNLAWLLLLKLAALLLIKAMFFSGGTQPELTPRALAVQLSLSPARPERGVVND